MRHNPWRIRDVSACRPKSNRSVIRVKIDWTAGTVKTIRIVNRDMRSKLLIAHEPKPCRERRFGGSFPRNTVPKIFAWIAGGRSI
jgi:hypothetical protein